MGFNEIDEEDVRELPVWRNEPGATRVYCAGPMFSPGEKWEQKCIAALLENYKDPDDPSLKYEIFLPQRDGIELKKLTDQITADPSLAPKVMIFHPVLRYAIFALDIYMVVGWAQAIVFNMNGRTPDDGGIVEATAAFMAGKAVVLYKKTPVSFIGGEDNPMIDGLGWNFWNAGSGTEILTELKKALGRVTAAQGKWNPGVPPQVEDHLKLGKMIWEIRLALEPTATSGWSGDLGLMIRRFPDLCMANAPLDITGNKLSVAEVEIGILPPNGPPQLAKYAQELWQVFSDGVFYALTGHERP